MKTMEATTDQTKLLAELSKLLTPENAVQNDDSSKILATILTRLDKLENQVSANQFPAKQSTVFLHPSQQKFEIAAANEIFLPNSNEKACRFEPDKPCDYCSMCSAHGF